MRKTKWILTVCLAFLFVVQSFVVTPIGAAELSEPEGLTFNPAKKNEVKMNAIMDNIPSTFELHVKLDANPNVRQVLFGNYQGGATSSQNIEITAANQLRYIEIVNGVVTVDLVSTGRAITTGNWTHLAVTRDVVNKTITFIQDGNVIETFASQSLPEQVTLVNAHRIGNDTRNQYYMKGMLSEVRLWNDVRTLQEITDNDDAVIEGTEEGLKHAWTLTREIETGLNIVFDKAGKINGSAVGFQMPYVIETPYVSEFAGTGVDLKKNPIEIVTKKKLPESPRTVEAWVNVPSDTPVNQRVGTVLGNYFDNYYPDISRFTFEISSGGNPRLNWKYDPTKEINITADVNVNVGDWVHVAMVLNDQNHIATTYINGKKINEQYIGSSLPTDLTWSEMKVGTDYRGYPLDGNTNTKFQGGLADVRVWSTSRTEEEIKANYKTSLRGNEMGLMGNWKLDNLAEGAYPDSSANGNDGLVYANDEPSHWLEPEFADGDYTIAVLPDTQNFVQYYPDKFNDYMSWIKDHSDDMNIKLAIQVGDLVNNPGSVTEWNTVSKGMNKLDGIVPYVFVPGNHDYNNQTQRNTTNYNKYFPYSKYSQASTFGGAYEEGKMDSTYHYFDINGVEYMVIALEYGPTDSVLAWANQLVEDNKDKKVIVTTHAYLYHNGEHLSLNHMDDPGAYMPGGNNGDEIWDEFVSKHENIVLVLTGHIGYPDLVVREDIGVNGNTVQQVLTNAQFMHNDAGMVMLMTFKEGSNNVEVKWYSVTNDKLYRANNQFSMKMNLYDEENSGNQSIQLSAVDQAVTKGSLFTVPVTVEQASELVGLEGAIRYDDKLLTLESFEFTAFRDNGATNTATPGIVSFAGISGSALGTADNTVIANLVFRAKEDLAADEETKISFANVRAVTMNTSGQTDYAPIVTKEAVITIRSKALGDVNGDNKIDIMDAAVILKLIVSTPNEGNEAMLAAADINGDQLVNTLDVLLLLQVIADKLAAPTAP